MLRMSDVPKRRRVVAPKAENAPVLMSNLPVRRGRMQSDPGVGIVVDGKPVKILSMSDFPARRAAARSMAVKVREANAAYRGHVMNRRAMVPQTFSDYVRNGVWEGRRCFIIGGGYSLKREDLGMLKGELVIGINRAYEICDPSLLFGVDSQCIGWAHLGEFGDESMRAFDEYSGYKVWMALHKIFPPEIFLIDNDSVMEHRIGTTKKLAFKNNSGYGAVNLAAALGAKKVYLLGFDMKGNRQGKQKWWHNGYPVDYGENIYKRYVEAFNGFAPVLEEAGVEVINLNPKSALKCFPFGKLRDVMRDKRDRPVAVSYYTRNTGYEGEAKRLLRDLHLFGFEHDVQGVKNRGSWQANTHYKAEYILEMMDKYPDRSILWLDADSAIHQYPDLFDDAEYDLGVCVIDWSQFPGGRRDKQLANAVIYLKNNERVRGFVQDWIALNKAQPQRIEMQTMAEVLEKWKDRLKFFSLPHSYCQIFDTMMTDKPPVIEQLQASRRFRGEVAMADDPVAVLEKKKYDDCWGSDYKRSKCAEPFANHILKTMKKGDRVLDIGCGDCTTLLRLRQHGVDCTGVDISLRGVPRGTRGVFEAPVWDMPFDDGQFDYTASTDVLEHVPTDKMEAAIREICRVTKRQTTHVVALFDGVRQGVVLHMTVKPIEWWVEQFEKYRHNGVMTAVMSRNEFMGEPKP